MSEAAPGARHIGIVFHDFPAGGTERIAIRLAGAWAEAGRRVTIFCGTEEGPFRQMVPPAVRVVEMTPPIRRSLFSRFTLGRRAAEVIEHHAPDIIFAPGNFHLPVMAVLLGRLRNKRLPAVVKISNPLHHSGNERMHHRLAAKIVRFLARRVDTFVAMSPALAEEARRILPDWRIAAITQPNLDHGDEALNRCFRISSSPMIVAAGRFVGQKDFGLAIRAFAALGEQSTAQLTLLGDGPGRKALEALARQMGVADRVTFAGLVPDIRPHLATATLLLLTSRFEGYPAVVVEALAEGVPVVATNCSPALRELIADDDFGRIVTSRSAEALAAAMHSCIASPASSREKLAASVRQNALGPSAGAYLQLFDSICAERQPGLAENQRAAAPSSQGRSAASAFS